MIVLACPKCKSTNINYIQDCNITTNGDVVLSEMYTNAHSNKLQCMECGDIFEPNEASTISNNIF